MASGYLPPFVIDTPRTVELIFRDYTGRRAGLIQALTQDADQVFQLCDPEKDNLCLFAYPDGKWKVTLPAEAVPSELPEPVLGINFARDDMKRKDWISLVAVHSDSWLLAVAFFCAGMARLNANDRDRLFTLINDMPDVYEAVRNWSPVQATPGPVNIGDVSGSRARSSRGVKRSGEGSSRSTQNIVEASNVNDKDAEEVTLCGSCRGRYDEDQFWIACDVCLLWYHGRCVGVTSTMAASIGDYKCPFCP